MPAFALTGRIRQAALVYAAVGVVWILASDRLLAWLVTDPAWYALGATLKGWAFVGLTALLLWWLGVRADTAQPWAPVDTDGGRNARARQWMALAAVALLGLVAVADTVQRHQTHRDADLARRAQASAARLDAWLGERLADARTYGSSKIYARLYEQWHDRPAGRDTPLTQRLHELQALKGWLDVGLYDAAGQLLWRAQADNGVAAPDLVQLAIQRREAVIGEPRVSWNDRLEIPMAVPLAQVNGAAPVLKIHLDAAAVLAGALVPSWGSLPGDNGALVVRSRDRWRAWAAPQTEGLPDAMPVETPALAAGLPVAGLAPDADLHTPLEGSDSAGHAFLARAKPLANAPGWALLATRDQGDDLQRLLRATGPVALAAVLGLLLTAALLGQLQRDTALRDARHERERSADRLRSAQLLQTVLDGAGIALVLTDTQGRVVLCSREAARLAGGDQPPAAGDMASDRLPPAMLHGRPNSGPHDGGVERWSTPVGDREFTVLRGTLRDDSGRPATHYVIARDVSAQQENERALARSEQQLTLALQGAELGLWDWQVHTGAAHFSDRWCTMLGYRPEDVGSHADSWRALVHPDDEPGILAVLQPHLAGQTATYRCEHRLRHRDGHWVWVLAAGRVVERDASGAPLRAVGIHLDISDRRAALQALEDSRAALEQRVEERTAALAEATQRAEAASVAKSAFLAN
ncbi:MAG: PAS domain-containing protein, partial [Rhodoferax sp.]|nr:PAS domain-containing protein [Rhodoferax sp.]